MTNKCGSCTACCRMYAVPEVEKKENEWCQHCDIGKGCRIYAERPPVCREFECFWLMADLPAEFRPDKLKVVFTFTTNPRVVDAVTMPNYPMAWNKRLSRMVIDAIHRKNIAVCVGEPGASVRLLLKPDGTINKVKLSKPDANGIRWGEGA